MNQVLIIEDERSIRDFVATALQNGGFATVEAADAASAQTVLERGECNVVLLDLGLPDLDGMELLKRIRVRWTLPVIVVSARSAEGDKVAALDCGADDYITKPFGTPELLARVRAALRHSGAAALQKGADRYAVDDLVIDYEKRLVTLRGCDVHLTVNEYRLVELLSRNPGKVLTYDLISRELWEGETKNGNQLLRVNMANIRRKLEQNPAEPHYIYTEVGVGYRMREKPEN